MDLNPEQIPFLERLAISIRQRDTSSTPLLVVLPNRRSLFVLKEKLDTDAVDLFTIDDLMQKISGAQLIESEELLVTFYQSYCKLEREPQSFDQFTSWALTFLSDINDVDLHLGDIDALYKHIKEFHETGESFKWDEAGPIEHAYLGFWERLPRYYKSLKTALSALKLAYRGMIYRDVAQLTKDDAKPLHSFFNRREVYWVGIIPGNPSERMLLSWIEKNAVLQRFADVDNYYIQKTMHEAGRLFREHPLSDDVKWKVNMLKHTSKSMHVYPIPGKIAQVVKAKDLLIEIGKENWNKTVVVLNDSSLLTPFMEMFADDKDHINITSGFPMRATLIHRFVMSWMNLHAQARTRSGVKYYYHKHLEEFLEYAVVRDWLSGSMQWISLRDEVVAKNMKFISHQWLEEKMKGDMFAEKAFTLLFAWSEQMDDVFQRISDVLATWSNNTAKLGIATIEAEAIKQYIARLKLLLSQFNELLPETDLKALKTFVHRQIGFTQLFIEQPRNDALQVMGMLETRMIDFEHVILLGATDDSLPGNPASSTHVPFVHRVHFKLPTRKDTEALIAYHFYRLMQRASHIHLVYNTMTDAFSSGEPSRYLMQMKEELVKANPHFKLTYHDWEVSVKNEDLEPLRIVKSEAIIEQIKSYLSKKVSPSSVNKFIMSPLEFYYYHVLGLKEQDEVEEDIEATTMGSVVHKVLETLYHPLIGRSIQASDIRPFIDQVDAMVGAEFREKFVDLDLKKGRNLLTVEITKNYLKKFLQFEINDIKANGSFRLLNLEERISLEQQIAGEKVRLFGFIDRVDERAGEIRIIDYKTGLVEQKDLRFIPDRMVEDSFFSKALQVAFYKYVYCKIHGYDETRVGSYVFSFRNFSGGYLSLSESTISDGFDEVLHRIISDMLDPAQALEHREETKYATF
ncbi:MAG: PD-(D/E)XK nuclease family protein [Salibacteraceae bacterium]